MMRASKGAERLNIKSAERALAIVEYFDMTRREASVSELCEALDIPQSSMSMLVKCLTTLGYIQKVEGARCYGPGVRAAFLGSWAQSRLGRKNPLCQLADEIAREVKQTVVIGTQNGPYVQYVYVASQKDPADINPRVGTKRLMACTAAGRSLLSRLEEGVVRRIARRNNSEAETRQRVPERHLIDLIEQERSQGFFESRGGLIEGINSITVLLKNNAATPLMLGVGGPNDHMMEVRNDVIDILGAASRDAEAYQYSVDLPMPGPYWHAPAMAPAQAAS